MIKTATRLKSTHDKTIQHDSELGKLLSELCKKTNKQTNKQKQAVQHVIQNKISADRLKILIINASPQK